MASKGFILEFSAKKPLTLSESGSQHGRLQLIFCVQTPNESNLKHLILLRIKIGIQIKIVSVVMFAILKMIIMLSVDRLMIAQLVGVVQLKKQQLIIL